MSTSQQAFFGPQALIHMMPRVLKPVLRRRSAGEAALMLDWVKIIKSDLAQRCYPEKLTFDRGQKEAGTLTIATDSGSSLLVQHSQLLLIECINGYFGYPLVGKIRIKNVKIPTSSFKEKARKAVSGENRAEVPDDPVFRGVKDPDLKAALNRFKACYEASAAREGK